MVRRHGQPAAWRHPLPGLFVAAVAAALALALLGGGAAPLLALLAAYAALVLAMSLAVAARAGWSLLPRLPAVIVAQQLSYGVGFLLGTWDAWRHGRGRERFARLTR